jgi:hypothetical protein
MTKLPTFYAIANTMSDRGIPKGAETD